MERNSQVELTAVAYVRGHCWAMWWNRKRTGRSKSLLPFPVFQSPSTKSQGALVIKNPPANARYARDVGSIPGSRRSPGEGNGNPLQYPCWRIPWTEEPDGLQSMGSQRAGHDWVTNTFTFFRSPSGALTGKREKCFVESYQYKS